MSTSDLTAVLPALYARWIDALLAGPIPPETRATCDDCAMCAPGGQHPHGSAFYFSPRVKCCSYQPRLPNYLVGAVLEDTDFAFSAGRETMERRIDEGVAVTPLGLRESARTGLLYDNSPEAFGRAESFRCPHYLEEGGGRCGIWKHRNSVCATYFCKYERGAIGLAFWRRLRDLLIEVEKSLAAWCVLESDMDEAVLGHLFGADASRRSLTAAQVDEVPEPEVARQVWGNWLGREREFYRECAKRVVRLDWPDVGRIGGSSVAVHARLTRQAFEALRSEDLPERLTAGAIRVASNARDGVRVIAYSGSDPLDLDPVVMQVLPYFDGRPIRGALASIEKKLGLRVEEDLLRKLADFEILVPPGREPA